MLLVRVKSDLAVDGVAVAVLVADIAPVVLAVVGPAVEAILAAVAVEAVATDSFFRLQIGFVGATPCGCPA
jgi:hypothetical protein